MALLIRVFDVLTILPIITGRQFKEAMCLTVASAREHDMSAYARFQVFRYAKVGWQVRRLLTNTYRSKNGAIVSTHLPSKRISLAYLSVWRVAAPNTDTKFPQITAECSSFPPSQFLKLCLKATCVGVCMLATEPSRPTFKNNIPGS